MLTAVVLEWDNEMGIFCSYYYLQTVNYFQMQSTSN